MPVKTWSVRIIPIKKGKIAVKKIIYLLSDSPKAQNIQSMYLKTRKFCTSFIERNYMHKPSMYVIRICLRAIPWQSTLSSVIISSLISDLSSHNIKSGIMLKKTCMISRTTEAAMFLSTYLYLSFKYIMYSVQQQQTARNTLADVTAKFFAPPSASELSS